MKTEAEIGYQDALHQILRHLHRRLKSLQDEVKGAEGEAEGLLRARISEVEHTLNVVESLHR